MSRMSFASASRNSSASSAGTKTMALASSCLAIGLLITLLVALGSTLPSPAASSSSSSSSSHDGSVRSHLHKHLHRLKGRVHGGSHRGIETDGGVPKVGTKRRRRIAIVVPYLAPSDSSPTLPAYFETFAASAGGSSSLVDFLIFHNGIPSHNVPSSLPSNVKLIDLKSTSKLAELFLRVLDRKTTLRIPRSQLIKILEVHMGKYPYTLVEFKPAYGHVFADYIREYSHWGYSDLDIAFGDLPRWITTDELDEFDLVTYGFGDQEKVYLRGQFTFHKNDDRINQLWRGCKYLSEIDERFEKVTSGASQLRFESAEGCYSKVVVNAPDVKVKYAVKAFTDVDSKDAAHTHGLYVGIGKRGDRSVVYKAGPNPDDGERLLRLSPNWFEEPGLSDYSDESGTPLQREVGDRAVVRTHRTSPEGDERVKCMYWAPREYQRDLCATNVDKTDTVFLIDGTLYKQRYETMSFPGNLRSYPLFHFQEWKRFYRPSQLGAIRNRERLKGWVLGKEGAIPLLPRPPAEVEGGGGTAAVGQRPPHRDVMSGRDRTKLPSKLYCLRSSQRKFPPEPVTSQCDESVSWRDEGAVSILSTGDLWDRVDFEEDVTLALTLQIGPSDSVEMLDGLLDVAKSNVRSWGSQPSVLIVHAAGATKEIVRKIQAKFGTEDDADADDRGHLRSCLAAGIFATSPNAVSRKALINMAADASPTRFVVSGLEIERGLVASAEASFFATRTARRRVRENAPGGGAFVLPQFGFEGTPSAGGTGTESGGGGTTRFAPASVLSLLDAGAENDPAAVTNDLEGMDCFRCEEDPPADSKELDERIRNVWWDLTEREIDGGKHRPAGEDEGVTLDELARVLDAVQLSLLEALRVKGGDLLRHYDQSPIIMVDGVGPRDGMVTSDLVPEVEELGGLRCFNLLRLSQLAALGYEVSVLPGAFASSVPGSREASCGGASSSGGAGGSEARRRRDGRRPASSRCDGCFMVRNERLLKSVLRDERKRPAKAAILWHDLDAIANEATLANEAER